MLARLPPGMPLLPHTTPNQGRVQLPLASVAPLSLVHPLLASLFLTPTNVLHLISRVQSPVISQRVGIFMAWLSACTIAPTRTVNALISVDLADARLEQRHKNQDDPGPPYLATCTGITPSRSGTPSTSGTIPAVRSPPSTSYTCRTMGEG